MNKNLIYILLAIVIIVAGIWFWMSQPVSNPAGVTSQGNAENNTTAAINQDLSNVTIQSPDFNSIDSDLSSL